MLKLIYFLLLGMILVINPVVAITLEDQFKGMKTCDQMGLLKGIYFDQSDQKVNASAVPYVTERHLDPCEVNDVVTYCIDDRFYGLKVNKITIPYTMSIYAIHFIQKPQIVKKQLSQYMKIISYTSQQKIYRTPMIFADSKNGHAILICDFSSEKD